jgi:hypothetical protein
MNPLIARSATGGIGPPPRMACALHAARSGTLVVGGEMLVAD